MSVLKLLVVDDEPGIRSGAERAMRNLSVSYPFLDEDFTYEIMTAESGEEALLIIDNTPVDILLLDNKLPGIDGIEVLKQIREKKHDIAVIMITSYASLDLAVKATTLGAYSFMPKPFTPRELRTTVEAITKNLFLRRMADQVIEENRQSQFQFLTLLSHELKSPINAVEGYLNIILEKQAGNSVDDYTVMLERCKERLRGMRALITDLTDLAETESGKKRRHITNVDLHQVTQSVIDIIGLLAKQKKVKIHTRIPGNCVIKADRNEIEMIISNIVSNAVKYNRDEGEVFIDISMPDNRCRIVVADTGIGISSEDQEKVFQDFVRIKSSETKNIPGSGLGLPIAKKMTELYGGSVQVESTPGKGSRFTVTIPL